MADYNSTASADNAGVCCGKEQVVTKEEIIEYLYENNVRGDLTIEQMAEEIADTPQTETQIETQNSNLTFEKRTMRDCYNCKRYETEGECIECHYEPKDEPQAECEITDCDYHDACKMRGQTDCPWK